VEVSEATGEGKRGGIREKGGRGTTE